MADNVTQLSAYPRVVRPVPDPLGLYIHVGRSHHGELSHLISAGDANCFGAVFDPALVKTQAELRDQVLKQKLDAILDPKTQQAATLGGFTSELGKLPWGLGRQHRMADFEDTSGRRLVATIGDFALEHGFTQILAPTHLLRAADDGWLKVDAESTQRLRNHLDRNGGGGVPIIYSLAMTYQMFRDRQQRQRVIAGLRGLPAAAIWLKIDGFGSSSSPTAALNYIEAAAELQELGLPVIGDHVGGVIGRALLSFGAASGMAHGVMQGERFAASNWHRPRTKGGGGVLKRIYVPALDVLLEGDQAKLLLDTTRGRSLFGCTDTHCCPRGVPDMIGNPGRHFLVQRMKEVSELSQIPETLRAQRFLEQQLRPATDKAVAAEKINWTDTDMAEKMQKNRRRLDNLRIALGDLAEKHPPQSFALLPATRAAREGRR